jgi:hypothetical protein
MDGNSQARQGRPTNVQDIVQSVLSAITNLPHSSQISGGNASSRINDSVQQFSTPTEELNSRFQIPRGSNSVTPQPLTRRVSSSDFNPRQNYSFQRRPGRRNSKGINVQKSTVAEKPELVYKDVCLLPNPDWNVVPRGLAKAGLVEKGLFVDAFHLDKKWDEARLYRELSSLFERVLDGEQGHEIG